MTAADRARILVVAQDFPWPATIGSHLRLAQVLDAASALGEVDLFCLVPARRAEPCRLPGGVRVARLGTQVRPVPRDSLGRRLRWALASTRPLEVDRASLGEAAGAFRAFAHEAYDAVWFSKASTFELLGRPRLGPTVVDLDDLEDRKILGRLALARSPAAPGAGRRRVHEVAARVQARLDARRWDRLQRSVAEAVDRVVLCSELDARRAGFANGAVVPNGFREPAPALGRPGVGDPPTVLFAGSTCYGPNADAARWLVAEIWPRVRAARPDAVLRLVGEPDSSMSDLERIPGVAVVGRVPAMDPELERADVVVVPLRYGSGTRVKILEAFAHRIPVVSTALGAEGLGARHGVHLLVADEPAAFAEACLALTRDLPLRARLVGEAQQLFHDRFRWESTDDAIRSVLGELARTAPGVGRAASSTRS